MKSNKISHEKDLDLNLKVELPHDVLVNSIPGMGDVMNTWRQGVKSIQEMFNKHVEQMTYEFEVKTQEFEATKQQLQENHEFIKQFYLEMQQRLSEKKSSILEERDRWERDREEIRERINLNGEVVAINVGGTHHMMTERDILMSCKGSILEKMFNGLHELKIIDNEVFLDRDGQTFTYLVNYLRNNREVMPDFHD